MKKNKIIIIPFILLLMQFSCTEIVDPDISGERVVLLAPLDNLITCNSNQTFWWEEIPFAERYNIQIVKPDFQNTEVLVLDSILTDNRFDFSLVSGNYQWRVAALNENNWTNYTVHNLFVDSLYDFSSVNLALLNPLDGAFVNEDDLLFLWEMDSRIGQYNFSLYYEETLVLAQTLDSNSYQGNLIWGDGEYEWSIQGIACSSTTETSISKFVLDTERPEAPLLISPIDAYETLDSIVLFEWERNDQDLGSELSDSLFVYTDSLLQNAIIKERVLESNYQDTLQSNQEYFWRIRTIDAANNLSNYSDLWSFKINR